MSEEYRRIDDIAAKATEDLLQRRAFAALENIVELVLSTPGVTAAHCASRLRELAEYIEDRS